MGLELCILGSGSKGNAILARSEDTAILIDAGLSGREITRRLALLDIDPAELAGICLTHEHNDHAGAARVLHRRHRIPLYANGGTVEALRRERKNHELSWRVFTTGAPFDVGDLRLEPFAVPHDAYEPVGFVVQNATVRVGILTDLGLPTHLIRERLRTCHAVVVESNYDETLLRDAPRPWTIKQRIMGRQGHLSNDHAGQLLADIAGGAIEKAFLFHLSEDCNRPDLALKAARRSLSTTAKGDLPLYVCEPNALSDVWSMSAAPQ